MFKRKSSNSGGLPTTMPLSVPQGDVSGGSFGKSMGFGNRAPDGSGQAIKMDAPIVKNWKQASAFTRYSYYILGMFIFMAIMGYRYLRFWNASIWLTCHATDCTLELTPPGARTQTLVFPRTQLHSAQSIKTDKAGNFLSIDTSKYVSPHRKKGRKGKAYKGSYKGPDEKGEYQSYMVRFHPRTPDDVEKPEDAVEDGDFMKVSEHLKTEIVNDGGEGKEVFVLYMRKFGLEQSRTRVRSMVNKVESYVKKRRQKLLIKESANLPWQGLLLLIFGLLGTMLTLLIGQFWEESPTKQAGPGARRRPNPSMHKKKQQPTFVVDTGRPSKYPPGYKKY